MPAVLRTGLSLATLTLAGALAGAPASANPATLIPSGSDAADPTLFHVTVDYTYTLDSATLFREDVAAGPLDPLPRQRDLDFKQYRHTLIPKAELGVYRDTWVSFAVPVVIAQSRELSLADGISRDSSSTIRDGLLTADGFDARDPTTPLPGGDDLVFRGATRKGVEQLYFGLAVAPMNQLRDATKPTWKLGAELRLAVGGVMRFDRMKAQDEDGISKGIHDLRLWTSVARRYDRTSAWFEVFWQVPLAAREGSLFDDIDQVPGSFGATNTMPGQQAGAGIGIEASAIDDRVNHNRVSLELGARLVAHFEGRDYSEMWEVFAYAGDVRAAGPLVLDRDPLASGVQASSHPGISNIENYLETSARIALRAQLGKRVRFAALVDLLWKTDHAISFADAGIDLPTCDGSARRCEDDANDLVNPGTREVNPLHAPRIDQVGHRYHSEDNFGFSLGVQAQALF